MAEGEGGTGIEGGGGGNWSIDKTVPAGSVSERTMALEATRRSLLRVRGEETMTDSEGKMRCCWRWGAVALL